MSDDVIKKARREIRRCLELGAEVSLDLETGIDLDAICDGFEALDKQHKAALAVVEAAREFHRDVGECSLDCEIDYRKGFDLLFEKLIDYDKLKEPDDASNL